MNLPFISAIGKLTITIDNAKPRYRPGDRISGTVELGDGGAVRARSFTITLSCYEFVLVSCGSGSNRRAAKQWNPLYVKETVLGGDKNYSACRHAFDFTIPPDAPPTILQHPADDQLRGAGIKWSLRAKLDVPWGVDANSIKVIFVE